jgi:tetratricopeptide (TPR) repeat protein
MITKRIPFALVVLLASLSLHAPAQTPNPSDSHAKTVAVVIGVSKYAKLGGGQQLQFAERDALLMAEALKKAGVGADNLRLLTAQDATVAAIKSAIGNWLARTAGAEDTAIIFFSGHGFFEQEFGEAYLLGSDSDAKEPFSTALSLNEINQALAKRVHARHVLLITDAMRRDFFDPDTNNAAATAFLRAFDQLAAARAGLSVIAASSANEFSREGQRWNGQGVFAKHLAAALATGPYIDRNNDGRLTADELFDVLAPLVAEDTSNKQHVWHSNTPLAQITIASLSRNATAVAAQEVPVRKPESPATTAASAAIPADTKITASAAHSPRPIENKPSQIGSKAPEVAASPRDAAAAVQPAASSTTPASPPAKDGATTGQKVSGVAPVAHQAESPLAVTSAPTANRNVARAEPPAAPAATRPSPVTVARSPVSAPPATGVFTPVEIADSPTVSATTNPISAINVPPPPRPMASLPKLGEVAAAPERRVESVTPASPVLAATIEAAPSPLILQLEAAIAAKNLLEPKNASAWEMYQKLTADPSAASDAARLRPVLADALIAAGRNIVAGEVCSDSIADRVDDFRRAGQMLARARSLKPESTEISALEKLSAAQALIALQFYEEAERALAPLQTVKLAAVENAMGIVHQGKLDNFRAERAFKRAIEIDPNWAAPHYNLALLYRGQQNDSALAELEQAAALDAKNTQMLTALGDEYFAKQQWPRAAESYRKAIAIKPADDGLHTKLGHALYSQGLQTEANREYQKARELRGHQ